MLVTLHLSHPCLSLSHYRAYAYTAVLLARAQRPRAHTPMYAHAFHVPRFAVVSPKKMAATKAYGGDVDVVVRTEVASRPRAA